MLLYGWINSKSMYHTAFWVARRLLQHLFFIYGVYSVFWISNQLWFRVKSYRCLIKHCPNYLNLSRSISHKFCTPWRDNLSAKWVLWKCCAMCIYIHFTDLKLLVCSIMSTQQPCRNASCCAKGRTLLWLAYTTFVWMNPLMRIFSFFESYSIKST